MAKKFWRDFIRYFRHAYAVTNTVKMVDVTPEGNIRITVQLLPSIADALTTLMDDTGYSKADVVNRAIRMYRILETERRNGARLLLEHPDGSVESLEFSK